MRLTRYLAWVLWFGMGICLLGGCDRGKGRPNLVLLTIDCLRVDTIAAYGGPADLTPNLNELAENGVVFEHAWSPMATTHPSHASMLTGFYPRYHGVRWNGDVMREDIGTLAEWLSDAGYVTAAFVSYKSMLTRAGLARGFDTVSDKEASEPVIRSGEELMELVGTWIRSVDDDRPVFVWIHLFEPHSPFEWTEYARERLKGYEGLLLEERDVASIRKVRREIVGSEEEMGALKVLYEGEVRESDRRVGEILELLRESGLLQNSVVVGVGDHGQGLGESGFIGHGPRLDEVLMRVPLIVRDFRQDGAVTGRVSAGVGLVDIAPTLLELAGEVVPAGVQGRSLLVGLSGREMPQSVYFGETERRPLEKRRRKGGTAVYGWPYKLVVDGRGSEVWELTEEGRMERRVRTRKRRQGAVEALVPPLEAFLADEWYGETRRSLSEEEVDELRGLGYVQ